MLSAPRMPREVAGVQTTAHRLTHFVAGQAGSHGPEEEFVIVKRVHGLTGGRVGVGDIPEVEKGGNLPFDFL